MELLKEALVDKNELEELREKVSLLKELEILLKSKLCILIPYSYPSH